MGFLDELSSLATRLRDDVDEIAHQAIAMIEQQAEEHPERVFGFLREVRPIVVTHGFAVVTRFEDVEEILTHQNEFTVALYAPKMQAIGGHFILGLDDDALYERDVSVLRLAVRRDDLPRIAGLVSQSADQLLADAAPAGRIDVVSGLTDLVPTRLISDYFGTPGPDEATQIRWARSLFREIFINLKNDPAITEVATAAAAEMRPHLDGVIAARKAALLAGVAEPDDVLGRLLHMQCSPETNLSDTEIRSNLIGLIVGAIPTVSKATALALDELLRRPEILAAAHQSAAADDDERVAAYMFEAMRLAPQAPGLFRKCAADYTVAKGTSHAVTIPAGTITFAATQSAMVDDRVIDDPLEFRLDRPSYQYLHFGRGLHTCFGRHINRTMIPLIGKALLRQKNLRRAPGTAGELAYDGPFPRSLTVEFDAP